jgi:serine/threonine protein phosphatase PrpC
MIRFSHGVATSVGRVRRVNEDSFLAIPPLYAVADGMGGHGSGDVASRLAIDALARCAGLRPLFVEAVLAALEEANRVIIDRNEVNRMGTTVTGLAGLEASIGGDHLMVFNVGDSRVYRLATDRVEQLTVDHSEVQELVLAGVLTLAQARVHPRRNIVTRALGTAPVLLSDHLLMPAKAGDRFLLCSDGLHGELPDEVILSLLAIANPQHAAEDLVAAANDAGGHDNVTAVVVDVQSAAPAPAFSPASAGADETPTPRDQQFGERRRPAERRKQGKPSAPSGPGAPGDTGGDAAGPPADVGLAGLGLIGPDRN